MLILLLATSRPFFLARLARFRTYYHTWNCKWWCYEKESVKNKIILFSYKSLIYMLTARIPLNQNIWRYDFLFIFLDTNGWTPNYNALTYILSMIKMTCYILYMICCLQHFLSIFSLSPSYHILFSLMMDIVVLIISLAHLCQRSYQ